MKTLKNWRLARFIVQKIDEVIEIKNNELMLLKDLLLI